MAFQRGGRFRRFAIEPLALAAADIEGGHHEWRGGFANLFHHLSPVRPMEACHGKRHRLGIHYRKHASNEAREQARYAQLPISFTNGSFRKRFLVSWKYAFATAGAIGGTPGSPRPVGGSSVFTKATVTRGASCIRITG